jgi:hypothetical protein
MQVMKIKINLMRFFTLTLLGALSTGCSIFGYRSSEQPTYKVLLKQENNEIRKYQSHIIAKTTVTGTFEEAQSKGFRILSGYIFGKNKSQKKIAMTSPVLLKPGLSSEKIEMTAPVVIAPINHDKDRVVSSWAMTFNMPAKYNLENLPEPEDSRIVIETIPTRFIAAQVFSGFWGASGNQIKADQLIKWLNKGNQYKAVSKPMFAGYNPPWTLPFFRRNEMLIEVKPIQ